MSAQDGPPRPVAAGLTSTIPPSEQCAIDDGSRDASRVLNSVTLPSAGRPLMAGPGFSASAMITPPGSAIPIPELVSYRPAVLESPALGHFVLRFAPQPPLPRPAAPATPAGLPPPPASASPPLLTGSNGFGPSAPTQSATPVSGTHSAENGHVGFCFPSTSPRQLHPSHVLGLLRATTSDEQREVLLGTLMASGAWSALARQVKLIDVMLTGRLTVDSRMVQVVPGLGGLAPASSARACEQRDDLLCRVFPRDVVTHISGFVGFPRGVRTLYVRLSVPGLTHVVGPICLRPPNAAFGGLPPRTRSRTVHFVLRTGANTRPSVFLDPCPFVSSDFHSDTHWAPHFGDVRHYVHPHTGLEHCPTDHPYCHINHLRLFAPDFVRQPYSLPALDRDDDRDMAPRRPHAFFSDTIGALLPSAAWRVRRGTLARPTLLVDRRGNFLSVGTDIDLQSHLATIARRVFGCPVRETAPEEIFPGRSGLSCPLPNKGHLIGFPGTDSQCVLELAVRALRLDYCALRRWALQFLAVTQFSGFVSPTLPLLLESFYGQGVPYVLVSGDLSLPQYVYHNNLCARPASPTVLLVYDGALHSAHVSLYLPLEGTRAMENLSPELAFGLCDDLHAARIAMQSARFNSLEAWPCPTRAGPVALPLEPKFPDIIAVRHFGRGDPQDNPPCYQVKVVMGSLASTLLEVLQSSPGLPPARHRTLPCQVLRRIVPRDKPPPGPEWLQSQSAMVQTIHDAVAAQCAAGLGPSPGGRLLQPDVELATIELAVLLEHIPNDDQMRWLVKNAPASRRPLNDINAIAALVLSLPPAAGSEPCLICTSQILAHGARSSCAAKHEFHQLCLFQAFVSTSVVKPATGAYPCTYCTNPVQPRNVQRCATSTTVHLPPVWCESAMSVDSIPHDFGHFVRLRAINCTRCQCVDPLVALALRGMPAHLCGLYKTCPNCRVWHSVIDCPLTLHYGPGARRRGELHHVLRAKFAVARAVATVGVLNVAYGSGNVPFAGPVSFVPPPLPGHAPAAAPFPPVPVPAPVLAVSNQNANLGRLLIVDAPAYHPLAPMPAPAPPLPLLVPFAHFVPPAYPLSWRRAVVWPQPNSWLFRAFLASAASGALWRWNLAELRSPALGLISCAVTACAGFCWIFRVTFCGLSRPTLLQPVPHGSPVPATTLACAFDTCTLVYPQASEFFGRLPTYSFRRPAENLVESQATQNAVTSYLQSLAAPPAVAMAPGVLFLSPLPPRAMTDDHYCVPGATGFNAAGTMPAGEFPTVLWWFRTANHVTDNLVDRANVPFQNSCDCLTRTDLQHCPHFTALCHIMPALHSGVFPGYSYPGPPGPAISCDLLCYYASPADLPIAVHHKPRGGHALAAIHFRVVVVDLLDNMVGHRAAMVVDSVNSTATPGFAVPRDVALPVLPTTQFTADQFCVCPPVILPERPGLVFRQPTFGEVSYPGLSGRSSRVSILARPPMSTLPWRRLPSLPPAHVRHTRRLQEMSITSPALVLGSTGVYALAPTSILEYCASHVTSATTMVSAQATLVNVLTAVYAHAHEVQARGASRDHRQRCPFFSGLLNTPSHHLGLPISDLARCNAEYYLQKLSMVPAPVAETTPSSCVLRLGRRLTAIGRAVVSLLPRRAPGWLALTSVAVMATSTALVCLRWDQISGRLLQDISQAQGTAGALLRVTHTILSLYAQQLKDLRGWACISNVRAGISATAVATVEFLQRLHVELGPQSRYWLAACDRRLSILQQSVTMAGARWAGSARAAADPWVRVWLDPYFGPEPPRAWTPTPPITIIDVANGFYDLTCHAVQALREFRPVRALHNLIFSMVYHKISTVLCIIHSIPSVFEWAAERIYSCINCLLQDIAKGGPHCAAFVRTTVRLKNLLLQFFCVNDFHQAWRVAHRATMGRDVADLPADILRVMTVGVLPNPADSLQFLSLRHPRSRAACLSVALLDRPMFPPVIGRQSFGPDAFLAGHMIPPERFGLDVDGYEHFGDVDLLLSLARIQSKTTRKPAPRVREVSCSEQVAPDCRLIPRHPIFGFPVGHTWRHGVCDKCLRHRKAYPNGFVPDDAMWAALQFAIGNGTMYEGHAPFVVAPTRCRPKMPRKPHNPAARLWVPMITTTADVNALPGGREFYFNACNEEVTPYPKGRAFAAAVGIVHPVSPPTVMEKSLTNLLEALTSRTLSLPAGHAGTGAPAPFAWPAIDAFLFRRNGTALYGTGIFPCLGVTVLAPFQQATVSQWLKGFSPGRATALFNELKVFLSAKRCLADILTFSAFVKREWGSAHYPMVMAHTADIDGLLTLSHLLGLLEGQRANPRTIWNPNELAHLIAGPVCRELTHLVGHSMPLSAHVCYAGGCTPETLNCWFTQFDERFGVYPADLAAQLFPANPTERVGLALKEMALRAMPPPDLPRVAGVVKPPPPTTQWCYYMADISACDQSHSQDSFHVLYKIYAWLGLDTTANTVLGKIFRAWLKPSGSARVGRSNLFPKAEVKFSAAAINTSGRDDTSLLNLMVNSIILVLGFFVATWASRFGTPASLTALAVLDAAEFATFLSGFWAVVLGDDSAAVVAHWPGTMTFPEIVRAAELVMAEAGFTVKGRVLNHITDFTFLGNRPVPTATVVDTPAGPALAGLLVLTPVLGRRLPKHHACLQPPLGRLRWLRGVAFAEQLTTHFLPVISALNEQVLLLTAGVGLRLPTNHARWLPTLGCRRQYYTTDDTLAWFYSNYRGITPASLEDFNRKVAAIPRLPWALSHPVIDLIFIADVDRQ